LGVNSHEKWFKKMKKVIPRAAALMTTLMIGLLVAGVFYRKGDPEIVPVVLPPAGLQSQSSDDRFRLSLCEAANALAYRGKEVVVEASHIGVLTSQRFSVLSKCGPGTVSAKITLVNKSKLPKSLLWQLSKLMSLRRESIDAAADKVVVRGVIEKRDAGGEDFDVVASDIAVLIAPLASDLPTHNRRLQRTRR
jgi:hypothetical protein